MARKGSRRNASNTRKAGGSSNSKPAAAAVRRPKYTRASTWKNYLKSLADPRKDLRITPVIPKPKRTRKGGSSRRKSAERSNPTKRSDFADVVVIEPARQKKASSGGKTPVRPRGHRDVATEQAKPSVPSALRCKQRPQEARLKVRSGNGRNSKPFVLWCRR